MTINRFLKEQKITLKAFCEGKNRIQKQFNYGYFRLVSTHRNFLSIEASAELVAATDGKVSLTEYLSPASKKVIKKYCQLKGW